MFAYITAATILSFPELQSQYQITIELTNWTVAMPSLGLAVGILFWSSVADIIGRRVTFISGTTVALIATIGAATVSSYCGYMVTRFFQGFGVSPAATVGLAIINDIFFAHERGHKVGLWVLALDLGLFTGPIVGGFMNVVGAIWIQWLIALLFAIILIAETLFLPETLYPRNYMLPHWKVQDTAGSSDEQTPPKLSGTNCLSIPRTKTLPFINFAPIPAVKHPRPWDSLLRFFKLFKYAVVSISVCVFCFGWDCWVMSIITMIPVAYDRLSPQSQA
jgi:MFS family permease